MKAPTDPEPLGHQVAVVVRARLLTACLDTATVILMLRLVASKGEFGILQVFLVGYELARYVATCGFPESVYYFFAKLPEGQRRAFAKRTFQVLTCGGVIMALALLGASLTVPLWLANWTPEAQSEVAAGLPILAFVAGVELPTWAAYPLLIAGGHGRVAGRFEVLTSGLAMVALVGPLAMGLGVQGVLWGLAGYAVLRVILTCGLMLRYLPRGQDRLGPGFLRRHCAYAIPLGLHTVVGRLNKYADKIIVGALLTEALLAEYGVAAIELPFITVFPYAVGSVLISRYVKSLHGGKVDAALALWTKAARRVGLLVIPAGVFAILAAEDLVLWVAGDEYPGAILPFALVATLLLHRVVQYGGMMQALDQTRGILRITMTTLAINVALSVPLTIYFGIAGTAFGTVIAQWFAWWLYLRSISRGLGKPIKELLPWKEHARVFVVAVVAASGAYVVRHFGLPHVSAPMGATLTAGIFFPLYLGFAHVSGAISTGAWRSLGHLVFGVRAPADGRPR